MSGISAMFPPAPTFTDSSISDLTGKIFLVTGSTAGVGFALSRILYSKSATVYMCGRTIKKANEAIATLKSQHSSSRGILKPLVIDLGDFDSVKLAAETVLMQEEELHILVHNAGVMEPPEGSKSISGHDLELATNCLGPHLLTTLLAPLLKRTAQKSGSASGQSPSVRVVWVVSLMSVGTPKGSMQFESDKTGKPKQLKLIENYMQSKVGGVFLAKEWGRRLGADGVLSVCLHPGLMRTELQRHMAAFPRWMMGKIFKPPVYGAYTELFAALSPTIKLANNGDYIMPWGHVSTLPKDIIVGSKGKNDGGSGKAERFLEYVEGEVRAYV